MADTIVVSSMSTFGDARSRDVYHRNSYQTVQASDAGTAVTVDNIMYGVTAATGSTHGANSQFQLAKLSAVEKAADGYESALQINLNTGTGALATQTVATLASKAVDFVSDTLSANFGNSHTVSFNGTAYARDGSTAATTQTFGTGGTAVALKATTDRLYVEASDLDTKGALTVGGDVVNWVQKNAAPTSGKASYKLSAANTQYRYTHVDGANMSTGQMQFNLDPKNIDGDAMKGAGSGYQFNSFDSTSAVEEVLKIGAGAAAGQQLVQLSGLVGIGQAPVAGQKLSVTGDSTFTGSATISQNLNVLGDLNVTGTVTSVNSTSILVSDLTIELGSNTSGATTKSFLSGGGMLLGQTAGQVSLVYASGTDAWTSNINMDTAASKSYFVNGGVDYSSAKGVTLNETGLMFGATTSSLSLGNAVTMTKDLLAFTSGDAAITLGSGSTLTRIDKYGISTGSDSAAVYFGSKKQWKIVMEAGQTADQFLSMQYCSDGTVTNPAPVYVTKFCVSV